MAVRISVPQVVEPNSGGDPRPFDRRAEVPAVEVQEMSYRPDQRIHASALSSVLNESSAGPNSPSRARRIRSASEGIR